MKVVKWVFLIIPTALVAVASLYILYAHIAWDDIPLAQLEARYGQGAETAEVDGLQIHYRLEGLTAADAPTIVLIHSHFFEMGIWDQSLPVYAKDYRVLRYDLAGHGLTGPDPSGIYSVERDVALLEGLLDQLGITGKVTLVGSSLGGNVAFTFAAGYPERVAKLVLMNSGGLKREKRQSGREMPGWADKVMPLVPPAAFHKFLRWMIVDDSLVTDELAERFVNMWRREGNRVAEIARLRQHEAGDVDAVLAKITAPTLVLWGEDNPQLPYAMANQFKDRLTAAARVSVKIYPGVGHQLPIERPEQSAEDTLAFLRETAQPLPTPNEP